MISWQTCAAAFLAAASLPFAALSQIAMSFDFTLAESVAAALMRDLHAATAEATAGLEEVVVPLAELVVVAGADVLVAGALVAVLEDELLPQPAASTARQAATDKTAIGLRTIISLLGCLWLVPRDRDLFDGGRRLDHAWSKIITTLGSSGSTLTVTFSPSPNGFEG